MDACSIICCNKKQMVAIEDPPSSVIIPSSINFGMLNPRTNSAAAAGQKAARQIPFFCAISRAHPIL
jgi:hypothetical protein